VGASGHPRLPVHKSFQADAVPHKVPTPLAVLARPQTPAKAGRLRAKRVCGEGLGDLLGAAEQGLAGMADDLSDGVEEQKPQWRYAIPRVGRRL
jgi:hypothetical protein